MVRPSGATLRRQRRRWDFSGRFDDSAWHLMHDYLQYEVPTPTNAVIAHRLNVAESTVLYWIERPPPSATPPPTPPQHDFSDVRTKLAMIAREKIVKVGRHVSPVLKKITTRVVTVVKFPAISDITREYNRLFDEDLAVWSVRRHLKALGFKCKKKAKGPYLDVKHKDLRLKYCKELLKVGLPRNMGFSDESIFDGNDHSEYQWVGPGEEPLVQHTTQGGEKVLAWGFIAKGHRKIEILPTGKTMGADEYIRHILEPNKSMLRKYTFQQDGAKCHTCRETKAWFVKNKITVVEWPATSPDLNPIENVWKMLKKTVSRHAPWGYDELSAFIVAEFNKIPQTVLDSLVDSFENRLRECVRRRGAVTKY